MRPLLTFLFATLVARAEEMSAASDLSATQSLSAAERKTLMRLLQKIYLTN